MVTVGAPTVSRGQSRGATAKSAEKDFCSPPTITPICTCVLATAEPLHTQSVPAPWLALGVEATVKPFPVARWVSTV